MDVVWTLYGCCTDVLWTLYGRQNSVSDSDTVHTKFLLKSFIDVPQDSSLLYGCQNDVSH